MIKLMHGEVGHLDIGGEWIGFSHFSQPLVQYNTTKLLLMYIANISAAVKLDL